jgi:alkanesulfonate monooxygenase SsuD/methylene tetrahydromethanopterin reductase-like flavin-dependent oxidoreductase (luciferase family)
VWIGAGSPAGIRRAARLGDAWPITPQVKPADLAGQLCAFFDARAEADKPRTGRQPLRREIMVGRDREDALAKAVQAASPWYLNMASTGHNKYVDPEGLIASIPGALASHWVLGDAADCAGQLRDIGAAVPVNPVITRANWPGMSPDESVAYIERLGEDLIPALKDFESVTSLA